MKQSIIALLNHIVNGGEIACYDRYMSNDHIDGESIDKYGCAYIYECSSYYTMVGMAGMELNTYIDDLEQNATYKALSSNWVPAPVMFRAVPEIFKGLMESGETNPVNAGTKYELLGLTWTFDTIDREAANWVLYQFEHLGREI